eukprot:TRINITY_DN6109_c0_g1_i1.p1 TRINITY_DN6109_c0_g1~~TRINITY_DN6109_c0_g1_i1.p1  ORF type:complete len:748 (-),score=154.96 TRINITY_DN6109_c0_g1_i1:207-2450(-)
MDAGPGRTVAGGCQPACCSVAHHSSLLADAGLDDMSAYTMSAYEAREEAGDLVPKVYTSELIVVQRSEVRDLPRPPPAEKAPLTAPGGVEIVELCKQLESVNAKLGDISQGQVRLQSTLDSVQDQLVSAQALAAMPQSAPSPSSPRVLRRGPFKSPSFSSSACNADEDSRQTQSLVRKPCHSVNGTGTVEDSPKYRKKEVATKAAERDVNRCSVHTTATVLEDNDSVDGFADGSISLRDSGIPRKASQVDTFAQISANLSAQSRRGCMEADKKYKLLQTFKDAEEESSDDEPEDKSQKRASSRSSSRRHSTVSSARGTVVLPETTPRERIEGFIERSQDSVMGLVVCLNAVYIGVALDMEDGSFAWTFCNFSFTFIYISDIILKMCMKGFADLYCGSDGIYARFDTGLVLLDVVQLAVSLSSKDAAQTLAKAPSAAMFRVLRLVKLARLLRLLRSELFADLLMMIHGIIGGSTTLFWSMVLFFVVIYVTALLHREFYGRQPVPDVTEFFDSVPRSIFTTFRCGFGDCTSPRGVPIFEYVHEAYGWNASIFYLFFTFTVGVGVFNVISAIFVESTMNKANMIKLARKKERLGDKKLWAHSVTTVIRCLLRICPDTEEPVSLVEAFHDLCNMEMANFYIEKLVEEPDAKAALEALDIDPEDYPILADIFDPDNGGTVTVMDLVDGIRKLRGEPRRSDIVTVDLMIRSLQVQIQGVFDAVNDTQEMIMINKPKPDSAAISDRKSNAPVAG